METHLTDIGKEKIEKELERLKKLREEKIQELRKLEDSNLGAWNTYGSELCAGSMSNAEEKKEKEIKRIKETVVLLKDVLSGELDISAKNESALRFSMREIHLKIEGLKTKKSVMEAEHTRVIQARGIIMR